MNELHFQLVQHQIEDTLEQIEDKENADYEESLSQHSYESEEDDTVSAKQKPESVHQTPPKETEQSVKEE